MAINQSSTTIRPSSPGAGAAGEVPIDEAPTGPRPANRWTMAAGWSLGAICVLHTIVLGIHPHWATWVAGPLRAEELTLEVVAQFWALPGGFVVPGVLLALMIVGAGRRGETVPTYTAVALGLWAAVCLWIVGLSGFVLLTVPVTLLIIAAVRARRRDVR